jgi:hypothetical protein
MVEELFDFLIAPQFDYLMVKFKKIEGFSFEIVALDQLNSELQFYFSRDQIARYISGSLAKSLMLEQSLLIPAPVMTSLPKPVPAQKEQTKPTGAMPPPVVLPWTSEEDGVAKNGEFVRTSIPAFSLRYPRTWAVGKATEDWIFNANPQRLPSMQIQVLKTGAGTEGAAGQIALTEEIAKKTQEKLLQRGAEKSCLEHVKPMEDIGGLPSCEFLITWRARVPDAAAGGLRRAYEMFNIPTYGRVLFAKDHAVIILYTLTPQGTTNGRPEHADQMIKILNTLMPISESYLIPAEAAPATITRTALPKSENALFPNPDIELSTPLTALGPADRNIAETGRLIRTASPAFSLSYPPEWALTQKPDRFSLSAKSASSLPSLQVMIAKISGEPSAFLQSLAGDYEQALKKKGSNIDLLYNKQTDVYEGHRAFEFEIRYKLKGRSATRTVYGNVIAKNGYAVLLAGETEGEIDSLKDIFETIDLKSDNERF